MFSTSQIVLKKNPNGSNFCYAWYFKPLSKEKGGKGGMKISFKKLPQVLNFATETQHMPSQSVNNKALGITLMHSKHQKAYH